MLSSDCFPRSVVLQFPPSVYQKTGSSDMLPQLLQILKPEDIRCIQFLRGEKVRVSFREKSILEYHLAIGVRFDDQDNPVTSDAEKLTGVYLRVLPYKVDGDDVYDFLSAYGEVLIVERTVSSDYPSICDGTRIVKISLKESLPYFLTVSGFECRIWYCEQPPQCFVCRELGHRAQACPLSGSCCRCGRPGHKARECTRALDPASASANGHSLSTSVSADPVLDVPPVSVDVY